MANVTCLANFVMTQNGYQREIVVHKDFFLDFYRSLNRPAQNKIEWTLGLVRDLPVIPEKYFKSIQGVKGLFEIRIQFSNDAYRIFCCLNESQCVVLLNGFKKKSNRTPKREIVKAVKLKAEYFYERRD
ncbi:MAG: type II toxin-antitoxin system RelE/ParE family toxin [Bacteroidetes bacterium]|nr:type II toxin-antitoxin system RelE/ParE family toxin [Bacteroidota bacterium]